MIFCLRQTQKKCIEQSMPLYAAFIDFAKAFETVSSDGLLQVLTKFGCSAKFVNIVKSLHSEMQASVAQGTNHSNEFAVTNGVKQGCILAPTLFSLYLSAMLGVAFGVSILTQHKADLFKFLTLKREQKHHKR